MKKIIILLVVILALSSGYSQEPVPKSKISRAKIQPSDFSKSKPFLRMSDFMYRRSYPATTNPNASRLNAIKQTESMLYTKSGKAMIQALQPEWRCIGPYSVGGRIKSIIMHPTKKNTLHIGAAAGGIWKSTNAGDSWQPIFDYENAISFGSLAIDNNNPDIIFAGTGEASTNIDAYQGSGIYRSNDGGATWHVKGLTECGAFSKIYVHPKNSQIVYAGVTSAGAGFYKSTSGGEFWTKTENFDKTVSDITINPDDENEVFVGVTGEGIYQSTDGGTTFIQRNTGLSDGIGRISIMMAPSKPDILYALMEISGIGNVFKSTNHGQTWFNVFVGDASFFNGQGWYDNYLTVNPKNENFVLIGGIDTWRTTDGGQNFNNSWRNLTKGYSGGWVHVDQHCAAFDPNDPFTFYIGNDGGIFISKSNGETFEPLNNGLSVTQFYNLAIDHTQLNKTYGGTQDNGTIGNFREKEKWESVAGGDGFNVEVSPEESNIIYGEVASTVNGSTYIMPWKRDINNNSYKQLNSGLDPADASLWNPPLTMDPRYSAAIYHGRKALYASFTGGDDWFKAIPMRDVRFSTIGVSPINENLLYAGTESGELFVSKDLCVSFQDLSEKVPINRFMSDIEPSKFNEGTVFITFSGYSTGHIFKSTNYGDDWTDISKTMPDIPVNAIAIHPNNENWLFAATDVGVFATFDGGANWLPYGRKLPRSPVVDIAFLQYPMLDKPLLRVATHGRSMWEVDVPDEAITEPEITSPAGGEDYVGGGRQFVSWYGFDNPVQIEYSTDNGFTWNTLVQNYTGNSYEWDLPNKTTHNARVRITSSNSSKQKLSNTFSIQTKQKGSVLQVGAVGHVPYGLCWDGKDGLWTTSFQEHKIYKLNDKSLKVEKIIDFVGDSLYSDLTIDRGSGTLYLHHMNPGATGGWGSGGYIVVIDTLGNTIKKYKSPVASYPIGLELVDGKLLACDRDGSRFMTYVVPETGVKISEDRNPFQQYYGPRGICYDGTQFLYQASTVFPDNGGALTQAFIIQIDKANLNKEVKRMNLTSGGPINARGIEYDPRDKNFWISDYGGNIFKIAGFETILDVNDPIGPFETISSNIYPNPMIDFSNISFRSNLENAKIKVIITNVLGESIGTFFDSQLNHGESAHFQIGSDNLSNGVYSVSFYVNGQPALTQKLIVTR